MHHWPQRQARGRRARGCRAEEVLSGQVLCGPSGRGRAQTVGGWRVVGGCCSRWLLLLLLLLAVGVGMGWGLGLGEGWVVGGGAAKSWSVTLFLVLKVWHARAAVCIPSTHCICCSCVLYSCVHEVRICSRDFLFLFITPRPRTDQRNPAVEPRGGQSGSAVPRWTPAPIPTATTQR